MLAIVSAIAKIFRKSSKGLSCSASRFTPGQARQNTVLQRRTFVENIPIDIQNSTMGELAVLAEPSILSLENNKEEENGNHY